jgi:hypothetical protein
MNRALFFLTAILIIGKLCPAQSTDSTFLFRGYVLDCDSLPVENVYLINFRSVRGFATDEKGRFTVKAQLGDSIKINHLSYAQQVIHANQLPDTCNVFILDFKPYTIEPVAIKYRNIEMENFQHNMKLIYLQMNLSPEKPRYYRGTDINPYAPGADSPGFGIDLGELIKLFRKKH